MQTATTSHCTLRFDDIAPVLDSKRPTKPQSEHTTSDADLVSGYPPSAAAFICTARGPCWLLHYGQMSGSADQARFRNELKSALAIDRVLTGQQLVRRGLFRAAQSLALPHVTYSCRTRATQPHSLIDLTFYAADARWLDAAPRDLMHWAGVAEGRARFTRSQRPPQAEWRWRLIDVAGRSRHALPDAELINVNHQTLALAVEFDAGYTVSKIEAKLEAAALCGYQGMLYFTSVHQRIATLEPVVRRLHDCDLLQEFSRGVVLSHVNFWSEHDPYRDRPRCHKPMSNHVTFQAAGRSPAGSGRRRNTPGAS